MPRANLENGTKVCCHKKCEFRGKPQCLTSFNVYLRNADGLASYCKTCARNDGRERRLADPDRNAKVRKRYRKRHPYRGKFQTTKYAYGIDEKDYLSILELQGGRCAICKTACDHSSPEFLKAGFSGWHVDHCHATGQVRGILCAHCNNLLGCAKDNKETLSSAINYLLESYKGLTAAMQYLSSKPHLISQAQRAEQDAFNDELAHLVLGDGE